MKLSEIYNGKLRKSKTQEIPTFSRRNAVLSGSKMERKYFPLGNHNGKLKWKVKLSTSNSLAV